MGDILWNSQFGHFSKTVNSSGNGAISDVTRNDISAEAFAVIAAFIYTDQCRVRNSLFFSYISDLPQVYFQ